MALSSCNMEKVDPKGSDKPVGNGFCFKNMIMGSLDVCTYQKVMTLFLKRKKKKKKRLFVRYLVVKHPSIRPCT